MRFDWWTFGLQTVNVLVLLWLLSKFLFKPAANIISARQAEAARLLAEASAARDSAEAERRKATAFEEGIAARRIEAIRAAEADAATEKQALLAAAHEDADRARAAAQDEIARTRAAGARAMAEQASELSVDIAGRLMRRLPPEAQVAGFSDGLARAVAALPEEIRAQLCADDAPPLPVSAARALSRSETGSLEEQLGRVLGRPVRVVVSIDPDLIAGLEIETAHVRVSNNLRADLDSILRSLREADHG